MTDFAGNVPEEYQQDGDEPPLRVGTVVDGKYELTEFLGCGGMGSVYRAKHLELGNEVAIKVLHPRFAADPSAVKRFQREARIISGLRHNNILSVFAFGSVSALVYMAMEYIEGRSLGQIIATCGPMTPEAATPLLVQICDGMIHAHKESVLHRDLKPDNAIVIDNPSAGNTQLVKVVDFGLAKLVDGSEGQRLTRTGEVLGDPNYMSPEQCTGRELDARSDIYSMGCLMYQVFTGVPPFASDSVVSTMYKQLGNAPESFAQKRGLPTALESITFRAMAKEPKDRYQSFEELKEDLQSFAADPQKKMKTLPGSRAAGAGKPKIPVKPMVALVVAVGTIGCLALTWGMWQSQQSHEQKVLKVRLAGLLKTVDADYSGPYHHPKESDLRTALQLSEQLKDDDSTATLKFALARMLSFDGRINEGATTAKEALNIPGLSSHRRATLLEILGKLHFYGKDYAQADKVLTDLYYNPQLLSTLKHGRSEFAYVLGTCKLRLGKIAEAEKVASTMKTPHYAHSAAINLETMFLGELLCRQKKFAEADSLKDILLAPPLPDLSKGTVLENFSNWFAINGDIARSRNTNVRLRQLANDSNSLFLEQRAATAELATDWYSGNVQSVLEAGKPLIARLIKPPVTPRLVREATDIYCKALDSVGRQVEATQLRTAMQNKSHHGAPAPE